MVTKKRKRVLSIKNSISDKNPCIFQNIFVCFSFCCHFSWHLFSYCHSNGKGMTGYKYISHLIWCGQTNVSYILNSIGENPEKLQINY